MLRISIFILFFSLSVFPQFRQMTFDDMWSMVRLGTYELSPDGKTAVYTASTYSLELNKGNSDIFLINVDGTNVRSFQRTEKNESEPRFSPDGKKLAYTFEGQIWVAEINGNNAKKVTNLSTGASGAVWSPDGKYLLFVSSVYPECFNDECNETKDKKKEESKVKASIFTELMYRHWNDWRGEKRSHLFLLELESGKAIDITLFSSSDVPPIALGSANDYTFSPDGKEIAFVMNEDKFLATSTNNDIFIVKFDDIKEGTAAPKKKISVSMGNDNQPVYSPDGKWIAFCSMERAGFEADKQRLMLYNRETGELKSLTDKFDRSVAEIIWNKDASAIFFTAENEIYTPIYKYDLKTNQISSIHNNLNVSNISLSSDGKRIFFKNQRSTLPYELFSSDLDGGNLTQVTNLNGKILAQIDWNEVETFWSKGADGTPVQSILVKPPFFDPDKKYPMIFLIHGGPQGRWDDDFHYRWNLQMFASDGYVVVAPNPRGSTGYGQKFTDEISRDWGGKVYTDLMNAYDYALENFSFIDKKNTFAAGASYGGYMINWIAGHTDRFNALVSHAGVFNLESMYGTTEELWFAEWENGGTPWENRASYEKWSPHRYIHNAKTPMLVVHGAYDFRVPEEQAFQLFTSLQRLGVPSKFLYFPDETHFVSKPQNAKLWWKTVLDWFHQHYKRN